MKIIFSIFISLAFFTCLSCTPKPGELSAGSNSAANNLAPGNSNTASKAEQTKQSQSNTQNERFETAPEDFKQIDFRNYSYPYKFFDGRKINARLKDGEFKYDFKRSPGWFSFSHVYYVDLTNDAKPEAIVLLWHVSCGVSCDGGAGLFYIYTIQQNKLKPLWEYETGSLGYGCGLKSFTVKNRKINVELFGRCKSEKEFPATGKFHVKDLTHITFGLSGGKFIEEKREFISTPETDVKNYEPEIRIEE